MEVQRLTKPAASDVHIVLRLSDQVTSIMERRHIFLKRFWRKFVVLQLV